MCGIFGAIGKRVTEEALTRVSDSLNHRGPDGAGLFSSESAAIGMTRLAILDLQKGAQPFYSTDKNIVTVCNGEIYNWKELRHELSALGYEFRTGCDAEILPAAWQAWGEEMFERFNGMFAIAVYDVGKKELVLARDGCGQKPLYYIEEGGVLYFASEVRALKAFGCQLTINKDVLSEYLMMRYVSQPNSLFKECRQLPGGSLLKYSISSEAPQILNYWRAPHGMHEEGSEVNNASELERLIDRSVGLTLQSDVPVGMYLSAGVDSTLLLDSITRQREKLNSGQELQTFTAGFGANSDEVKIAKETAKRYGVSHEAVELSSRDLESLPNVVKQMEVPVGDGLILAFDRLAKASSEAGCKVVLGGEGPDELFLGYSFQKVMWMAEKMGGLPRAAVTAGMKWLPASVVEGFSDFPATLGDSGQQKLARWFGAYSYSLDWWKGMGLRTVFEPDEVQQLLVDPPVLYKPDLSAGSTLIEKHYRKQFSEWLPDWSIIRQDRNTMAHSVEYRIPFLDKQLINFSGRVPLNQKLKGKQTKWLWREVAKNRVGSESANRVKQPFYFPIEQYRHSDEYKALVNHYLSPSRIESAGIFKLEEVNRLIMESEIGEFLPLKKVFSLLIFEIWRDTI